MILKNLDDPILRILTDRDPRLKDDLRLFAIEKLQSSNKFVKKVSNETIEKVEIQKNQDNKLAEKLKKMTLENEQCKLYNSDDDEMSELSDNNEIISKEIDIKIEPELELDSDSEIIDEVDDDSAISAILINTKKGKVLYLDPNTLSVIEPEGDNEGDIIGRLIETPKKYGTIEKDNKFWTVISKIYCKEFDKDYLYDVLNYRLFDDGYNLIGNVYKNKEDKFQFQFNK